MTPREKISVEIAALYALNRREEAVKLLKRMRGTPRHLVELFFHLSLLVGFPAMLDGIEKLASIGVLPRTVRRQKPTSVHRRGLQTLRRVYGNQTKKLLASLKTMHPELPSIIVRDVYGRVISRPGLSLRERELVNMTVLTIQGLNRQLYSHVRGALRMGVSASSLRRLLTTLEKKFRVNVRSARKLLVKLTENRL